MSVTSGWSLLRQAQCTLHRAAPGPSNILGATVQTRHYAQQNQQQQQQKVRSSKVSPKSQKNTKKERKPDVSRRPGELTFGPMPRSAFKDPVFYSERPELVIPPFVPELTTPGYVGTVVGFDPQNNDPIKTFGLPKSVLIDFRILPKPLSVIRDVTVTTIDRLQVASEMPSSQTRLVMTGSPGCGKSFLLLQMVEYAARDGWLVLYIPRSINLVDSTTTHVYDLRTQTYLQPVFAYQTLQRFRTANYERLQNLHTSTEIALDRRTTLPAETGLIDLIDIGTKEKDSALAPVVLDALMTELERQTRYPVLLAVDDFQALYCKSAYRDPQFAHIRSWHLAMPRLLLQYASGQRSFARGAVLGALGTASTEFSAPRELLAALGGVEIGPYEKQNQTLLEYAKGLEALVVPEKMQLDEAAAVFEVYDKNETIRQGVPKDELFVQEYTAAQGNPRGFVKGILATLTI